MKFLLLLRDLYIVYTADLLLLKISIKSIFLTKSSCPYNVILIIAAKMKTLGFSVCHAILLLDVVKFQLFLLQTLSMLQCAKTIPPNWTTLHLLKSALLRNA